MLAKSGEAPLDVILLDNPEYIFPPESAVNSIASQS
jgi:hypothetical protein